MLCHLLVLLYPKPGSMLSQYSNIPGNIRRLCAALRVTPRETEKAAQECRAWSEEQRGQGVGLGWSLQLGSPQGASKTDTNSS